MVGTEYILQSLLDSGLEKVAGLVAMGEVQSCLLYVSNDQTQLYTCVDFTIKRLGSHEEALNHARLMARELTIVLRNYNAENYKTG